MKKKLLSFFIITLVVVVPLSALSKSNHSLSYDLLLRFAAVIEHQNLTIEKTAFLPSTASQDYAVLDLSISSKDRLYLSIDPLTQVVFQVDINFPIVDGTVFPVEKLAPYLGAFFLPHDIFINSANWYKECQELGEERLLLLAQRPFSTFPGYSFRTDSFVLTLWKVDEYWYFSVSLLT